MKSKILLRRLVKKKLIAQGPGERRRKSRAVEKKLFGLVAFRKARTVCFYVSTPTEVDTHRLIDRALQAGKRVLVPRVHGKYALTLQEITGRDELKPGAFGIHEPHPAGRARARLKEVQCVIVPGLAFDREGYRLGRGRAYYDRFLKRLGGGVFKIGLAFSFQMVKKIPREAHDVKLDCILTG